MGKIATEQEAYEIGQQGIPIANKCCTKSRAEALGCEVSGAYLSNQLVQQSHLSSSGIYLEIVSNIQNYTSYTNWGYLKIITLETSLQDNSATTSILPYRGGDIEVYVMTYYRFHIRIDVSYDTKQGYNDMSCVTETDTYEDWSQYYTLNINPYLFMEFAIVLVNPS